MRGTKGQHMVAQSLSRRFTTDGERFFAFDKTTGRAFPTSVGNVAKEAYFYDLPAEVMAKIEEELGTKQQFMEKILAAADRYAKTQIDEILEEIKAGPISRPHRIALANLVALQFSRTALNRQLLREANEKLAQVVVEDMVQKNFPEDAGRSAVRVEYSENEWVIQQAQQILNEDHMVNVAAVLDSHIWIFGINDSQLPLYTSDHPVVRAAHASMKGIPLTGLAAPGIEIAFPLTSKCVLFMLERSVFRHLDALDGRPLLLAPPFGVDHFNALQVKKCFRQVYCEKNEFEQAKTICEQFPECCDPNRPRVKIVNTENEIATFFLE
jgi:hypothetical protein